MSTPMIPETSHAVNPQNLDFLLKLPCHPIEHRLLVHLAQHAGQFVARDELWRTVWGDDWISDSNLYVQISTLRGRLPSWARIVTQYQTWYQPGGYKLVIEQSESEAVA